MQSKPRPGRLRNRAPSGRVAARGTVQLMVAEACLMACGYLTVIMLARGLGPNDYGVYGTIMSILVGVELTARLGIPQALGKLIPEHEGQSLALEQTAMALSLTISAVVFFLFWVSAPAMATLFQIPHGGTLLRLAALDIPFYGMYFVCDEILGGRRQFGAAAIGALIYGLGKAIGVLLLVWWGISISGALIVNILASVAALCFMATHISLRPILPTFAWVVGIFRVAIPLGLLTLGVQVLLNLDLWSLRALGQGVEEATVGAYIAAGNVAKLPTAAAFVMTAVLIPSLSRAFSQGDRALAQRYMHGGMRFLCVVLVPICGLFTLTAEPLMAFLYSQRYADGAVFLRLLVFAFGLSFTYLMTFCAVLIGSGAPYGAAGVALALVPCAAILNGLFIPAYGALGATIAVMLTMTLGAVVSGIFVRRRTGLRVASAVLKKVAVATAVMMIIAMQLRLEGPLLIPAYVALLGGYAITLAILGELTRDDLQPFVLWRRESAS